MKKVKKVILAVLIISSIFVVINNRSDAADVLDIGISARSIGLGRTYAASYGFGDSIFGNPAGLRFLKRGQIVSMYGELSSDVRYTTLGYAYPAQFGSLGIGYAGNVAWDLVTTTKDASGRVVPLIVTNYVQDLFMVDFARSLTDQISCGFRAKYYKKGSADVAGGIGTAANLDLGVLFDIDKDIKTGIVVQNILPGSLGAMKWGNGYVEEMGIGIDAGISYIGRSVSVYGDVSSRKGIPLEAKLGSEFKLWQDIMLRLGIEQKALSREEKYSSYSLGLGYKYSDIGLDYAYFYDGQLPYNSRHFISLAIDFPGMKGKLINLSNRDKMVAASEAVAIKGEINHPATKVSVGGKEYKLYNRMFEASVPVNVGKNKIEVIAMNEDNNILGTAAVKVLKMKTFVDVKQNYWAREAIENIGTLGIVAGFSAGKASEFKPDWGVNRAEMVTFLCSAAGVKPRRQQTKQFWDVPVNYWAAPFIKYGSDKGWVKGYEDKTFKPVNKVTKEQAVAIMVRFMGIEPDKNFEKPYDDVDPKSWASPYIAAAKKLGLLSYIKGKDFGPEKNMSRAEVCEIISKMPSVSNRIDDLLNFNIGY